MDSRRGKRGALGNLDTNTVQSVQDRHTLNTKSISNYQVSLKQFNFKSI